MTQSKNMHRKHIRYHLLATVSATALLGAVAMAGRAHAADSDHATLWIEAGGAFDQISADNSRWLPPNLTPPIANPPPGPFGGSPRDGFDEDLKLSFTPDNSDWIFSASIRYGRTQTGPKRNHDQSYKIHVISSYGIIYKYEHTNKDFANSIQKSRSRHATLDFQAGKDLGLGMFGGTSVLSAGVRVAKLNENANGHLTAFVSAPVKYATSEMAHNAAFRASRSFNGIGPTVSWDASAPLVGTLVDGLALDWGVNAAILFGQQKSHLSLLTKDTHYFVTHQTVVSHSTQNPARSKSVMVPNVGALAGLSWRLPNAKVSIGYRADMFFSAIDGGLTTSKSENRAFYGPYASISVGLGD